MGSIDAEDIKIGIIGEGKLANLLSDRLSKARFFVHRLSEQESDQSSSHSRSIVSPSAIAQLSDIVITICSDGPELEEILFGHDGVAAYGAIRGIIIDMSNVSPELIQELSEQFIEKEIPFLDATILNEGQRDAENIQMVLVGGEHSLYQQVLPVFEKIANEVKHIGVNGASQFYRQAFGVRAKRT